MSIFSILSGIISIIPAVKIKHFSKYIFILLSSAIIFYMGFIFMEYMG